MNEALGAFNGLQMTGGLALGPFFLGWLRASEFSGHNIAFWVGAVIYFVLFVVVWACTSKSLIGD